MDRCRALVVVVAHCAIAVSLSAQTPTARPDTLSGRVTTDSAAPLPSAPVLITRGPDRALFRTLTDSAGRWRVVVDSGTGDYLVYVAVPGRKPERRRITRGTTTVALVADFALAPSVSSTLETVKVVAKRREAPRDIERSLEDRASAELPVDGVTGAVSPVLSGDIAALASTVAGVQMTAAGPSVLGIAAGQNLATLNGLGFGGGELPRGVATTTRVLTTSWDIARGGFSGAQVDVSLGEGYSYRRSQLAISGDAPALQATDATGRALGVPFMRADLNLAASGPVDAQDRFGYSVGARIRRRAADVPTLASASPEAWRAAGLGPDSALSVLSALRALGVAPPDVSGTMRTDLQLVGRVDRMRYDEAKGEFVPRVYGLVGYFNRSTTEGIGRSPLAADGASGRDLTVAVQAVHSLRSALWLQETKAAISVLHARQDPVVGAPLGTVRVASASPAQGGLANVSFGGNDRLVADLLRTTYEATHTASAYATPGSRHLVKVFAQVRADTWRDASTPGGTGQFTYLSVDELRANRPATFTRLLSQPTRSGGTLNAALGVGSVFRPSRFFHVEYGLRGEANRFLSMPVANGALDAALGVNTAVAPFRLSVSPRLGFRWIYAKKIIGGGITFSNTGTRYNEVNGVLRGGIGEFRNFISPEFLATAMAGTGVAGQSVVRLTCVGAAVPTPDWGLLASSAGAAPSQCAAGATSLAQSAAPVTAISPAWRTPRAWRSSLGWSTYVRGVSVSVEGVASLNLDQPSTVDANFAGTAVGAVADEAGRPRFAGQNDITAAGQVSPLASRRDPTWASARVLSSGARSVSTQMRVTLDPPLWHGLFLRTSYVLGRVRAYENGFDRNTAGDPRTAEWAPGDLDVRHQVQAQAGVGKRWWTLTAFVNVFSGLPYTPMVAGDVNGDGLGFNDRAYVSRTVVGDAQASARLGQLLDGGPLAARRCLAQDDGRIARRNGCRGPWVATTSAMLTVPIRRGALGAPWNLSLFVENPLAGVDRLLHGDAIRGWGAPATPDPVLLAVRGFDAATGRFRYDVNPRFGATDPQLSTLRAPFRVTLDVSIPLGPTMLEQQLVRALRDGRTRPGPRMSVDALKQRYARGVRDPFRAVLAERDSLFLSPAQIQEIEAARRTYLGRIDSVWTGLATYLANLEDRYDSREALARQEAAIDAGWEVARQESRVFDRILLPVQLPLLPWPADYLRTAKPGIKFRVY